MVTQHYLENILGEKIREFPYQTGRVVTSSGKKLFLKSGNTSLSFLCEANGLKELAQAKCIRVAEVIAVGDHFILTDYIENHYKSPAFFENFGRAFAQMHRYTAHSYGFYEDNFIGLNPQKNIPNEKQASDWTVFFYEKRLLFQFRMAENNGYVSPTLRKRFSRLENNIDTILAPANEKPSLLHGDLWSGNFLCDHDGKPVLIDPAVYYGHREADLAMTSVFGGFPESFYKAYHEEYPLHDNWEQRLPLYKLYHILNHLNLFGTSYLHEAESLLKTY